MCVHVSVCVCARVCACMRYKLSTNELTMQVMRRLCKRFTHLVPQNGQLSPSRVGKHCSTLDLCREKH